MGLPTAVLQEIQTIHIHTHTHTHTHIHTHTHACTHTNTSLLLLLQSLLLLLMSLLLLLILMEAALVNMIMSACLLHHRCSDSMDNRSLLLATTNRVAQALPTKVERCNAISTHDGP